LSERAQLAFTIGAAALAAVGAVIGITLATRDHPATLHPQPGKPPVPKSLPGTYGPAVRQAIVSYPHGTLDTLQKLELAHPKNAEIQLYFGIALLWAGYTGQAEQALQTAKKKGVGYDQVWEVLADNILHPQYAPNYPIFQPIRPNALLERGFRLQEQDHQHSAERLYLRAAKENPNDDQSQVAAAVGAFNKNNLNASFGKLGPLTARFPKSQIVRFYLGELLAWTDQRDQAIAQFRKAVALGPTTGLGKSANEFLSQVNGAGTGGSSK
jgi:predicted Zn-dependent protease